MSVLTLSAVGKAVRLGVLLIPSLGAAAPTHAADLTTLYNHTTREIRLGAQQLCEVAAPYQQAPGWSVLHGHVVNMVAAVDQLDLALGQGDLPTARALADQLEELGECLDDVAEDLGDWVCPRTPARLYERRIDLAEDLADFLESRTDRLRRIVRSFQPVIGGGCPLSGGAGLNRLPAAPLTPAPVRPLPAVPQPLNPGVNAPFNTLPSTPLPNAAPTGPFLPPPVTPAIGRGRVNPFLAARYESRLRYFGSRGVRTNTGPNSYRFGF
ncbi:MAG: hypothetical protein AAF532_14245 [Planctomycetota bacterium]